MAQDNTDRPFIAGGHHARFIDENVPMHVISRIFQGRHLLRPCAELNAIIVGVIARARELYPAVSLFALAFLSNHMHLLLQGNAEQVPRFIGFIKREISRRWGGRPDVKWGGTMWHEYLATALPTPESQVNAMKYVLSQGVKENLVECPQDWPGVHSASSLMTGEPLVGLWFDATGYAKANDLENRCAKPKHVHRINYEKACTLSFDALPAWSSLTVTKRRDAVKALVSQIVDEAATTRRREGKSVLGAEKVLLVPLDRITTLPALPWFEKRRRRICWADPRDERVKAYVARYWEFQDAFVEASREFRAGNLSVPFPPRAFRPITHLAAL